MGPGRSSALAAEARDAERRPAIADQSRPDAAGAPTFDDQALVAAVLAGDRDAFRRLVERESDALVRACQRVLGDHADAEDAAQEAFVTAYRSLGSWRGEGTLGAWLTRIGIRIALRQASRRRTVAWLDPTAARSGSDASPAVDRAVARAAIAAAPATDPALLSLRSERATEIRAAVVGLPEPYREVVALRFFADSSLEQIARQTGRPLATVKTHLYRGLDRLRFQLEGGRT